jgi:hypothetical protein
MWSNRRRGEQPQPAAFDFMSFCRSYVFRNFAECTHSLARPSTASKISRNERTAGPVPLRTSYQMDESVFCNVYWAARSQDESFDVLSVSLKMGRRRRSTLSHGFTMTHSQPLTCGSHVTSLCKTRMADANDRVKKTISAVTSG